MNITCRLFLQLLEEQKIVKKELHFRDDSTDTSHSVSYSVLCASCRHVRGVGVCVCVCVQVVLYHCCDATEEEVGGAEELARKNFQGIIHRKGLKRKV